MLFIILFSLLIIILSSSFIRYRRKFQLWENLKVPYIKPRIPFGNFADSPNNIHFGVICKNLYDKLKKNGDYAGIYLFHNPNLLAISPEFVKKVIVEDFNVFMDRGIYSNTKIDPLTNNIFFREGSEWKKQRQKLTSAFSSGKMQMIFHTLTTVCEELIVQLKKDNVLGENECDMREITSCFTTDVIASCIFGLDGNSIKNSNSQFRQIGKKAIKFSKLKKISIFFATMFPAIMKKLNFRIFDKEFGNFFQYMVSNTIEYRKKNQINRNDLMQVMMEMLNNEANKIEGFTVDEIVGNAFMFFFAGFDTSSITITIALYYLALNQNIQEDLRQEINYILTKFNNELTYANLQQMDLLERVILETLRIFPPIATLHRISNQPYKLPNGSEIPKGTNLIVPIYGIHHDPSIYDDPDKFNPSRFLMYNKLNRHPYSFIPFGDGPRMCIGHRFAMIQVKSCLISILKSFKIQTSSKTQIPLKIDATSVSFVPEGPIWLKLCIIKKTEIDIEATI